MFDLFKRKIVEKVDIFPHKGEKWGLGDDSPWPLNSTSVDILDQKDGWVRYSIGTGGMFPDERMEMSTFIRIYSKIN